MKCRRDWKEKKLLLSTSVVLLAAVAVAKSDGEVVIRARSASKKLLKSASRHSNAAATAAAATIAGQEGMGTSATALTSAAAAAGFNAGRTSSTGDSGPTGALGPGVQQVWDSENGCYELQGGTGSNAAGSGAVGSLQCTAQGELLAAVGSDRDGVTVQPSAAAVEGWQGPSQGYQGTGTSSGSTAWAGASHVGPDPGALAGAAAGTVGTLSLASTSTAGTVDGVYRQTVPEGRRVTGSGPAAPGFSRPGTCPDAHSSASVAGRAADSPVNTHGQGQPAHGHGVSRRSTREAGPGGSRASTPPNRGFFAGSTGNGAFTK